MNVEQILESKGVGVVTIGADRSVLECAGLLARRNIGAIVVTDALDRLMGIISERDLARGLDRYGCDVASKLVRELMTMSAITCKPDQDVGDVVKLMCDNDVHHLPVVSRGSLAGVLSLRDVVYFCVGDLEDQNDLLRERLAELR